MAAQFNGNIGGMTWKSDGDDKRRRYDFSYDAASRLLKAEFKQNNTGSTWDKTLVDFTVQMGNSGADDNTAYDANGNILKMKQWGLKLTGPAQIDNLTYTYWNSGNMLKAVTESGSGTTDHQLGDFTDKNTSTVDYGYDRNGNLAIDLNKGINGTVTPNTGLTSGAGITYNHLNLPVQVTVRNSAGTADKGTITYSYDAAGIKIKKTTVESGVSVTYNGTVYTTDITTTTTYLGGTIFESKQYSNATVNTGLGYTDKLQFFSQEEGRVRAVYNPASPNTLTALEYDYMIKDHLGNVRMVLTEELKNDAYPEASMETAQAATENIFYSNLDATRVDKPSGYPTNSTTEPDPQNNHKVAMVRGDGNKIGPAILLKVMAGDKFNLRTRSWYVNSPSPLTHKPNPVTPGTPLSPITDLIGLLNGGIPGISGGKITSANITQSGGVSVGDAQQFLSTQNGYVASRPKAFVNWVLFDEQLKFVENGSGFEQVPDEIEYWNWTLESRTYDHIRTGLPVTKNGYLYIYVSNETPNINVYFDNLQVTHIRGPLVEESHYYPFGLTMAGISSKALTFGDPRNKIKFQAQEFASEEFSDRSGLDMYEFKWRMHDPKIGRFWQIDPLAEKYTHNSTYAFSENKVISHIELEGLESKLAIAGKGNNLSYSASDVAAFNARAQKLEGAGFTSSQVQNGRELVAKLREGTATEGSVSAVVIFAHASQAGVFLDNNDGFYTENYFFGGKASASVTNIEREIEAGTIKFEENAVVVMGSCNCGRDDGKTVSLAESMAERLGVTVYAATGNVYPEIVDGKETGRLKTDGTFNAYQRTPERTIEVPGYGSFTVPAGIGTTNVGKTIDPAKLVPPKTN